MQKLFKRSAAVLLSMAIVLSAFAGLGFGANAAGSELKTLAVGETYLIGDVIYFENDTWFPNYVQTFLTENIVEKVKGMKNLAPEDMCTLPVPTYQRAPASPVPGFENGSWEFDPAVGKANGTTACDWYMIYVPAQSSDKMPVGVKCVSGDGTGSKPFRFEAIYSVGETWTWTYSAEGNTITATCDEPDASSPQTLTLNAVSRPYSSGVCVSPSVTMSDGWKAENGLKDPTYKFFTKVTFDSLEADFHDEYGNTDGFLEALAGNYAPNADISSNTSLYYAGDAGPYVCIMTAGNVSVKADYTVTAASADNVVYEPPTPIRGLVYNGEAHQLFNPGSVEDRQEMYYTVTHLNQVGADQMAEDILRWKNGDISDYHWTQFADNEELLRTAAGSYTVWYAVYSPSIRYDDLWRPCQNYETVIGSFDVEIERATLPYSLPDVVDVTYGQVLGTVSLPQGVYFRNSSTRVWWVGARYEIVDVKFFRFDAWNDNMEPNYVVALEERILVRASKRPLTITADPVSKTAGEDDPELTYTVDGLVNGDTLTGALEREAGEEPGTYTISLGTLSAGSNYDVRFTGSTFTIEAAPVPKDKQSVTIDDQISVNFLLDLDKRVDVQSVVIAYIDPQTGDVQQSAEYTEFGIFEKQGDLYKIPAEVAPAQLSETVRVTILYGENEVQTLSTSVAEYCETLIDGDQTAAVKALARATLEYGQAANDFFGYNETAFSTTENAEAAVDTVKNLASTLRVQTDKITGAAFAALTKPEFRFYTAGLTEAEAAALNGKIEASGGVRARFVKTGDAILLEVTGIEAADMAKSITVKVDGREWISFTGNDFARLLANYEPTAVLGAALYNYGAAAAACFNV